MEIPKSVPELILDALRRRGWVGASVSVHLSPRNFRRMIAHHGLPPQDILPVGALFSGYPVKVCPKMPDHVVELHRTMKGGPGEWVMHGVAADVKEFVMVEREVVQLTQG